MENSESEEVCRICCSSFEDSNLPLIICENGHTICYQCTSRIKENTNKCPCCRFTLFATPIINREFWELVQKNQGIQVNWKDEELHEPKEDAQPIISNQEKSYYENLVFDEADKATERTLLSVDSNPDLIQDVERSCYQKVSQICSQIQFFCCSNYSWEFYFSSLLELIKYVICCCGSCNSDFWFYVRKTAGGK